MSPESNIVSEEIQDAASVWLARRDRGLTATEQDAYLEWLYADPLHGRAIVQLERVWATLNKLEQWRPAHSAIPNPDLLAPRRHSRLYWLSTTLSAAAAIAMAFYIWSPGISTPAASRREAIIHPGAEKMTLPDGSVVELNQGAKIDVRFTPGERHVRLASGEAYFTVAHNAARPFFVDTDKVSVRAVGTAFSVSLASTEVAVLVREGKVQVIEHEAGNGEQGAAGSVPDSQPGTPVYLITGERKVVKLEAGLPVSVSDVQSLTPAEIERLLAWQGMRLEFVEMPLGDVVAEFNRYNRQKITVTDSTTAAILVGGNFRADNVDAFVRLLGESFGVTAFSHGDEIVLRKVQ